MEMLSFFFDQFRVPIIGFLVLGTFAFARIYLVPVRVEKVNESVVTNTDDTKNQSNIAD